MRFKMIQRVLKRMELKQDKGCIKNVLLTFLILVSAVPAQNLDGFSLGLAGNATSLARGIEAIFWNPANLSMYRPKRIEINFLAVNTAFSNSSFSLADYNRFFSIEGHHGEWSDTDKNALLAKISPDGMQFDAGVNTNLFGLVIGPYGFGVQLIGNTLGKIKAGKALDIFLFGENFDKNYTFQETDIIRGTVFSAAKLSFASSHLFRLNRHKYWVSHIAVGFNVNYYAGLAYARTLSSDVQIRRVADGKGLVYQAQMQAQTSDMTSGSLAGSGFGLDLGTSIRFKRAWNFSMSLNNLFAGINCTGNTRLLTYTRYDSGSVDGLSGENLKETKSYAASETFSTPLPVRLQMGLSLRLLSNLSLTTDWRQNFSDDMNASKTARFGFSVEYKLFRWLPLRSGVSFGGKDNIMWALCAGIHTGIISLDISYALKNAILPMQADGFYTAATFKIAY